MIDTARTSLFVAMTMMTPGPNNILCASMGARHGYRRALPLIMGISVGFFLLMLLCAMVSAVIAAVVPRIIAPMRIAGAIYVTWLALEIYRSRASVQTETETAKPHGFLRGLTLQFMNPKAILYGLTVFTVFLAPIQGRSFKLVLASLVLALAAFTATSLWSIGGQSVRQWASSPCRARALAILFVAALAYTALDLSGLLSLLSR
ncbi:LysE family transporter [Candidatus Bipolaricaulota bacterium]|nr:LysE family transporter [Candidatus Bipolaricaulota bacterium]